MLKRILLLILPCIVGCVTHSKILLTPEDPRFMPILAPVADKLEADGWRYYRESPVEVRVWQDEAEVKFHALPTNSLSVEWQPVSARLRCSDGKWGVVSAGWKSR